VASEIVNADRFRAYPFGFHEKIDYPRLYSARQAAVIDELPCPRDEQPSFSLQ
jgi:hypothetical protein